MKSWTYYQNPEFLEKTRLAIINKDLLPYIVNKLRLKPNIKILDVGCGSGEFTFFLGSGIKGSHFTGLDQEEEFINCAKKRAASDNDNSYDFVVGNGLELPFDDNYFDVVVSHTFLTAVVEYEKAISEMKRVCKIDGLIASVAPTDYKNPMYHRGKWPFYFGWKNHYDELYDKLTRVYEKYAPVSDMVPRLSPMEVPNLFADCGLTDISAYPVAALFSLSNADVPDSIKRRYIELDYASEIKKINAFVDNVPGFKDDFQQGEVDEYIRLLKLRRDTLLAAIGENKIWEWQYAPMVLISGIKNV